MKVIYIAGKYRGPTPWAVEQNIRAAEDVGAKVIAAGHMPLTPHKNTAHMEGLADDAFFLAGTMELLRRCDAVLCVSNWRDSVGARAEVVEARRLGLPVFGVGRNAAGDDVPYSMEAAIIDLCEWAAYDDKTERKWSPFYTSAEVDAMIADRMAKCGPLSACVFSGLAHFVRKHGTAERWDVCNCEECEAARPHPFVAGALDP